MAKSPEEMAASMIANLVDRTGKTLPQWLKITKASKLTKHGELTKLLKTDYDMTHGFANLIAHKTLEAQADGPVGNDALVDQQYAGAKAELRPIHDAIVAAVKRFGKEVEVAPKKAYVSLRRSKQFAIIQPSTKTRVDVGINLKGKAPTKRLEESGSFNAMVSHRVSLSTLNEVDKELKGWLKDAFKES